MNQLVVVLDFFLQLHFEAQQLFVALHLLLHLSPHILQLILQADYDLVEGDQSVVVLCHDFVQIVLQSLDL